MPTQAEKDDPGLPEETPEQTEDWARSVMAEIDARPAPAVTASLEGDVETYKGFQINRTERTAFGGAPVYEFTDLPSIVPADAQPLPEQPGVSGREWVSCIALAGVPTADGRMLGPDVGWRDLPLTLMALLTTDEGHKGAFVCGRIDSIETMPAAQAITAGHLTKPEAAFPPDALAYVARGVFDESWQGDETMRLVDSETLRGVSVDLSPERVEVVELPPAAAAADGEAPPPPEGFLEIVTAGQIMGATVCPFPAFKEANIRIDTPDAAGLDEPVVAAMRGRLPLLVITAAGIQVNAPRQLAAVDHSQGCMVAVHPTGEQAAALAAQGGQPAGDLHCTLAYLDDPDAVDFAKLNDVVSKVAAEHDTLQGRIGGAGYFAAKGAAPAEEPEGTPDDDESAEYAQGAPADPETDPESEALPANGEEPGHAHVALVDAPGLSKMRQSLCEAMDAAGIPYSQEHDFTPHITLGYESAPAVPAMEHAGKPVTFGHLAVHEGMNRTVHALNGSEAVTASAAGLAPELPPSEWFEDPGLSGPTPLTVTDEGRIYGHLATWGTCHIGKVDECVQPPESLTGYALFHLGHVITQEGELIPVGTLTLDTGHADLHLNSTAATMHYDHTGTAAADIRVGDDEHGIWFNGAIRPDLDARSVRKLRAAKVSGDWRPHDGTRELVAALSVNVPGFPVLRPRTAITASGRLGGLIAAGIDLKPPPADTSRTHVLELAERARPGYLEERRAALAARVR